MVQDFNPDETLDSEKQLPGSILHEYAPVCSSFKKKRDSMNQQTRDVKQEQEGKKDVFDVKFRGVDADDYDICTSPRQYSYGSPYRRTQLGRKQVTLKDSSSISSMVHRARVKHDVGTVKSSDPPPGGVVARLISKDKCQKGDRSKGQHGLRVVDSVRSHESELRTKNDHGLGVADSVRIQDSEIQPSVSLPAGSDGKISAFHLSYSSLLDYGFINQTFFVYIEQLTLHRFCVSFRHLIIMRFHYIVWCLHLKWNAHDWK